MRKVVVLVAVLTLGCAEKELMLMPAEQVKTPIIEGVSREVDANGMSTVYAGVLKRRVNAGAAVLSVWGDGAKVLEHEMHETQENEMVIKFASDPVRFPDGWQSADILVTDKETGESKIYGSFAPGEGK